MGLHDRPYWRDEGRTGGGAGGGGFGGMTVGLPRPTPAVKYLLIINLTVFVLQLILQFVLRVPVSSIFGATVADFWQVWRYLTFQFLHDPTSLWHIGLNMLALFMFGSSLERHWGTRRFVEFYLSCGAVAGLAYVIMGALLGNPSWVPLIGASGGVYGILLACAVLFPHMRIIMLFFPVPIRLGALIIFGGMALFLLTSFRAGVHSGAFWSHVAHLGGAGTAAVWVWVVPRLSGAIRTPRRRRPGPGAWDRRMQQQRQEQAEIDRVLGKIHTEGLDSLSRHERQVLQKATRRHRGEDNELTRL